RQGERAPAGLRTVRPQSSLNGHSSANDVPLNHTGHQATTRGFDPSQAEGHPRRRAPARTAGSILVAEVAGTVAHLANDDVGCVTGSCFSEVEVFRNARGVLSHAEAESALQQLLDEDD